MKELPEQLRRYLPDSEFRVVAWNSDELVIEVEKEIGPETGIAKFSGVSFVNLPTIMTVYSMQVKSPKDLSSDFWNASTPDSRDLETDDLVFIIESSWGGRQFVIAKSLAYEVSGSMRP